MKNKFAIISLIFGILSLNALPIFVPIIFFQRFLMIIISLMRFTPYFSIIGIITGVIAIIQILKRKQKGLWMAILGIIFSIIGTSLVIFLIIAASKMMGNLL